MMAMAISKGGHFDYVEKGLRCILCDQLVNTSDAVKSAKPRLGKLFVLLLLLLKA